MNYNNIDQAAKNGEGASPELTLLLTQRLRQYERLLADYRHCAKQVEMEMERNVNFAGWDR